MATLFSIRFKRLACALVLWLAVPGVGRAETVGAILPGHILGFWRGLTNGMERAARDLGVSLIVRATQDGAVLENPSDIQVRLLDDMVQRGVVSVVLAPEPRAIPTTEPVSASVPVILMDREGPHFKSQGLVATDNYNAGRKAALTLVPALGQGSAVGVFRLAPGIPSTTAREAGFISVAREQGWAVVIDRYVGHQPRDSQTRIMAILRDHRGGLDAVFAPNETVAFGTVRAMMEGGMSARPRVVAFDWRPEFRQALADGVLHAAILQDTVGMGYRAVAMAVAAARGMPVPAREDQDVFIVTKSNMDDPIAQSMARNYNP